MEFRVEGRVWIIWFGDKAVNIFIFFAPEVVFARRATAASKLQPATCFCF